MSQSDAEPKIVALDEAAGSDEALPFVVELWDRARDAPERVIGRAATIVLAQAIFQAAQVDFAGERITLCREGRILMDTQ